MRQRRSQTLTPYTGAREVAVITTVHNRVDPRIYQREIKTLADAGWTVHYLACGQPRGECLGVVEHRIGEAGGRLRRVTTLQLRAFRVLRRLRQCRIVHAHDPALIPLLLAMRLLGWKIIFDLHEDFPAQLLTKPWLPFYWRKPASRLASLLEMPLPRIFDALIVAEPVVAARLSAKGRIAVVENYVDLDEVAVQLKPDRSGPRRLVYVGGVTRDRGLLIMIELVRMLTEAGHHVRLDVLGPLQDATPSEVDELISGLPVIMHGYMPA